MLKEVKPGQAVRAWLIHYTQYCFGEGSNDASVTVCDHYNECMHVVGYNNILSHAANHIETIL